MGPWLVAALLSGCGRYFRPDINLDRYASDAEIVGRWALRPASLAIAKRDGYAAPEGRPHELVFHINGECEYRTIRQPSWRQCEYTEASVAWMLQHDVRSSGWTHKNELILTFTSGQTFLHLTEEHGKLVLWTYWRDPDAWELLQYDKHQ